MEFRIDVSFSVKDLATAMMTTDTYPKCFSKILSNGSIITIVAKGAGMIEPNMGTMLCIIMTDANMSSEFLHDVLKRVVDKTFNNISIDGDSSTSDACIIVSTGLKDKANEEEFESTLLDLCFQTSEQIVRNGEGVKHLIEVNILNYDFSTEEARQIGKNIVNSNLVKTAVAGNDPNIGRILGSMGRNTKLNWENINVSINNKIIYSNNSIISLNANLEKELNNYLNEVQIYKGGKKPDFPVHNKTFKIDIDFNKNTNKSLKSIGGDLTEDYVSINAEYRS